VPKSRPIASCPLTEFFLEHRGSLDTLPVQTTYRSRRTQRLVRHRNDHWAKLTHRAAVPANRVSCAQDAPKLLRPNRARCRFVANTPLTVSRLVPKVDGADGAKICLGQSGQRQKLYPESASHVAVEEDEVVQGEQVCGNGRRSGLRMEPSWTEPPRFTWAVIGGRERSVCRR